MAKVKTNSTKKETLKESAAASNELAAYLKKHKLDPDKDWTKDPVHGKKVKKLVKLVQLGQEKEATMPKKLKKPEVHPKKEKVRETLSYDYPEVDGKPMSKELRKRFRTKMRSLLKANMDPKEASKKALQFCLTPVTSKPKKEKEVKENKETKAGKVSKKEAKPEKKDKKAKKEKEEKTKKVKKEKETSKKSINKKPREED